MLAHPDLYNHEDCASSARETFAASPPLALAALGSVGADRFWRLSATDKDVAPSFPRDILQTVPSNGRPDLLLAAIDLVEALARGSRVGKLVDELVDGGVKSFETLAAVVHELGWLAARSDPTIRTVVDLNVIETSTGHRAQH